MSLVGSLEDLSLGDILQIISLSQKSGVLVLRTAGGGGRIVFVSGLVRGAAVKSGPQDLRDVLVGGGFLSDQQFEAAADRAELEGGSVAAAVAATTQLSMERIDSLCRETVESAVVTMFSWTTGDFSFDVRSGSEAGDPELLLPTGINAQYLAMEGTRLRDESGRATEGAGTQAAPASELPTGFDEMSAHELFGVAGGAGEVVADGVEPDGPQQQRDGAIDSLAMAVLERVAKPASGDPMSLAAEVLSPAAMQSEEIEAEAEIADDALIEAEAEIADDALIEAEAEIADDALIEAEAETSPDALIEAEPSIEEGGVLDLVEGDEVEEARAPHAEEIHEPEARPEVQPTALSREPSEAAEQSIPTGGPLVVLSNDLLALEWVKNAVKPGFSPVHVFQQTEQGLARIRQYIVRGAPLAVLISPDAHIDPLGGIRDTADFVTRLKSQSPHLIALWLRSDEADPTHPLGPADGAVTLPERSQLRCSGASDKLEELAAVFLQQIQSQIAGASPPRGGEASAQKPDISPDVLRRLRDATKALTEASSRGEVLPLAIRFAADVFARVAMFMVRDGVAAGIAQHGLDRCGGPDDIELREVSFDASSSAWMSAVLEQRKPVCGAPSNSGDLELAELLGDRVAGNAYLAPIESAGQAIALLYGDNLPEDGPIGDTSALEVVLHHAGLALDRAALERALREDER